MPTTLETIDSAINKLALKLEAVAADPDHTLTYTDLGATYKWNEYILALAEAIRKLTALRDKVAAGASATNVDIIWLGQDYFPDSFISEEDE